MALDDKDIIQQYKDDLTTDTDMVLVQSRLADDDMRFINVDGGQWDDNNNIDDNSDRAKLELDIVSDYVYRFVGEWNQNRVGVEYKPEEGASDEDAELLNGIYRADFRQNEGKMAVDNAVDEVATVGYGCFKLKTFFEDKGDPENDNQRIGWEPINNAYDTVMWDASAKKINKSDAKRCVHLIPFTKKSFAAKWPNKTAISAFTPETRFHSDWIVMPQDIIYVAVRYDIIEKTETHFIYNNLQSGEVESYTARDHDDIKDELKKDEFREFVRERKIKSNIVEKVVFSGDDILEKSKRIAGKFIPIIAIYGYHAFVDNSERYRGLVRKLKDAARLFNSQVSQLAENSASQGQDVPVFFEDEIEGYEQDWANKNNKPYLKKNPHLDSEGNEIPVQREYNKPAQLDASTSALMQIVPNYVQQITGRQPEETRDPRASGKAIKEARKLENLNTQVVLDNIANGIEWSAVVYQSITGDGIYTTQRIVNTIDIDGTESKEQLLKTVLDEQTGKLVEANNLNGKRFRAYADIGPQYETLREQATDDAKGILEIVSNIEGGQKYIPVLLSILFENMSGIGTTPIKEFNRKQMILQGTVKPKTDEEKQFLAEAQQQQNQPDPTQKLIDATATKELSEAKNLDAASVEKIASAGLKEAQEFKTNVDAQKLIADIQIDQENATTDRIKTLAEIRKEVFAGQQAVFQTVQGLPL